MHRELTRDRFSLLDVILAVQEEAKDDREVVAALMHLLRSGENGGELPSAPHEQLLLGL